MLLLLLALNKNVKVMPCMWVAPLTAVGANKAAPSTEWHSVNPHYLVWTISCIQETHKSQC